MTLERIHLEILRLVEQEGTLTAAAKRLFLTQSALSHSIRKVEENLGVSLWRREGRSLLFTEEGAYLLKLAKRLLPQLEQAEEQLAQYARGERGTLRIGVECHPCYRWLLKVVAPYLERWPQVDLDVIQKFQFGGIGALYDHEIDLLVTPDPLFSRGLHFVAIFDYEQVLVVGRKHALARRKFIEPEDLVNEVLITYPVSIDRLDVFSQFLTPAGVVPERHKEIGATDIMLQMVASGRGVAALPRWLAEESAAEFSIRPIKLGRSGVAKSLYLGVRAEEQDLPYLADFLNLATAIGHTSELTKLKCRRKYSKKGKKNR